MKPVRLFIFLPLYAACNMSQSNESLTPDKLGLDTTVDIYTVPGDDPSMNQAIIKARKTIAQFDHAFENKNPSYTDFAVKKRYNTSDDGGEHMWVAILRIENGNYKGFVNNDAVNTTEVEYGDTVIVRKEEVTDWMYLDNNVLRGGFTIREIRKNLNREDRKKMDQEMGFNIED